MQNFFSLFFFVICENCQCRYQFSRYSPAAFPKLSRFQTTQDKCVSHPHDPASITSQHNSQISTTLPSIKFICCFCFGLFYRVGEGSGLVWVYVTRLSLGLAQWDTAFVDLFLFLRFRLLTFISTSSHQSDVIRTVSLNSVYNSKLAWWRIFFLSKKPKKGVLSELKQNHTFDVATIMFATCLITRF